MNYSPNVLIPMLKFLQEAFLVGVNNMYNTNKSLNDDLVKKNQLDPPT